jgi:transcriptional regulator with XRE-family HTH domain
MPIGAKIRLLRERQGMTQEQLGNRCGLSRVSVCKLENSKPECLRLLTVVKVCSALGVDVTSLLD